MAVRITGAARERLLEIWNYTEERWGEAQADRYLHSLVETAEQAHKSHHLWRPVPDEELKGAFFIRYQHHFIFFRELSADTIGVISILHENMDIPARLKDERGRSETE